MDQQQINREIFKAFKSRGLSLRADASKALARVLLQEEDLSGSLQMILGEIKDRIEKKDIKTAVIDLDSIESIVADLSTEDEDYSKESTQLLDAFDTPRIDFDERLKSYKLTSSPPFDLHPAAESKPKMFRDRLVFIQQRLFRSTFKMRGMGASKSADENVYELSTVDSLLGITEPRYLCGYLVNPVEGETHLEDLTGIIQIVFAPDVGGIKERLFAIGCIVIVQGAMEGKIFVVTQIAMPPAELREQSLNSMGLVDAFGNNTRQQQMSRMLELENESHESLFVIISDVLIDNAIVLEKLQVVFEGYEQCGVDPLFILIGPFTNVSYLQDGARSLITSQFRTLADLICTCPRLSQNAKFVLVPSAEDPGMGSVLPRRKILDMFTKDLKAKIPNISFASNPCRIRFFTQEIVIFRESILRRMQRNLVYKTNTAAAAVGVSQEQEEEKEPPQLLAHTLLDQGHLAPLPMTIRPIYWELDHAMRLNPIPDLLVLADQAEQFNYNYRDCNVTNPGSFVTDFSFLAYRPATRSVEFSRV